MVPENIHSPTTDSLLRSSCKWRRGKGARMREKNGDLGVRDSSLAPKPLFFLLCSRPPSPLPPSTQAIPQRVIRNSKREGGIKGKNKNFQRSGRFKRKQSFEGGECGYFLEHIKILIKILFRVL